MYYRFPLLRLKLLSTLGESIQDTSNNTTETSLKQNPNYSISATRRLSLFLLFLPCSTQPLESHFPLPNRSALLPPNRANVVIPTRLTEFCLAVRL